MYSNNMKKIRLQNNMKLKELSEITGISSGYLSHLEKGNRTNPSYSIMKKISVALKSDISDIFE